jgi:hypothetical protein
VSPQRFRTICQDIQDTYDSLATRYERAYNQTHIPSRRPSKAGRVSGDGDADITYSDPVGQTAALLLDMLDRMGETIRQERDEAYQLARMLEDFAPARQWDNGIRRCGEEGCARRHHAVGLCQNHYKRMKMVEARKAS